MGLRGTPGLRVEGKGAGGGGGWGGGGGEGGGKGEEAKEEDQFLDVLTDFYNWASERQDDFEKHLAEVRRSLGTGRTAPLPWHRQNCAASP